MMRFWKRGSRRRRVFAVATAVAVVGLVSGCKTVSFYTQAAKGQFQILTSQVAVFKLMEDPATAPRLKQRLALVAELRQFAEQELELPVNGHYRKYSDLHRPFVVWNVQAAPEFSMEPKTWWYPVVGRLEYRGYFTERAATNYADWLRKRGYDVHVGGVSAYSTLGWFKDPLLNTFVFDADADLAETILHELSHQRVFARGDTDFNEAFATTVGQEATCRWLKFKGDADAYEAYQTQMSRNNEFVRLVASTRSQLEKLYGDQRDANGKIKRAESGPPMPPQELRRQKERILGEFRKQYGLLRQQWDGDAFREHWVERPINNAKLNSIANYYDLVPGFQQLLRLKNGNLGEFYAAAADWAKKSKKERHEWLQALARDGHGNRPDGANEPLQVNNSPFEAGLR